MLYHVFVMHHMNNVDASITLCFTLLQSSNSILARHLRYFVKARSHYNLDSVVVRPSALTFRKAISGQVLWY